MTVAEYITDFLISQGVTDAFGIPGGVILDLLYAFDSRKDELCPHLCYHEQSAGFAAEGYAQSSGRLGVAYATKGPGFTNMLTPMADAYSDSIPVLFITAHSIGDTRKRGRLIGNQDLDTCSMVEGITKFAARIDAVADVIPMLNNAVSRAISGRKGPVFLDFSANIWKGRIDRTPNDAESASANDENDVRQAIKTIERAVREHARPVLLIGDGIRLSESTAFLRDWLSKCKIPVVSSRSSHDLASKYPYYLGYVGSHGIRSANFAISKADAIISLGNRLDFPVDSVSFAPICEQARIYRFEIDDEELSRNIPNSYKQKIDIHLLLRSMNERNVGIVCDDDWLNVCLKLKEALKDSDVTQPVEAISKAVEALPSECVIISDVGNNEFWLSRACVFNECGMTVLYSKSFGSMGSAIGKSIGAYYATRKPVACFVGDQGFQLNSQELKFIAQHNLPISIILVDNNASGMIRDRERLNNREYDLHTTLQSGYGVPDFKGLAEAYGLPYFNDGKEYPEKLNSGFNEPCIWHLNIDSEASLTPYLPKGEKLQKLHPVLDRQLFEELDKL